MADLYCDYNHKRLENYWLVVPDVAPLPQDILIDDWQLVRKRAANRLSDGGRKQVDDDGYAILRFHVALEELKSI
ncbi:MAG: hypothetical protein ACAH27_06080 [Xanthobacteraceae bacterium]